MTFSSTRVRTKTATRRLGLESFESRRLLAVDMLANVQMDDGARFTPRSIVGYQGQILFRGDDGFTGPEAWITSGDPDDVRLLKDIRVGPGGSGPRDFTEYDGRMFFAANNGTNGYELWVTQGSKASTQLMGDIWEGVESGIPTEITTFQGQMYFFANDGITGRELYRSDGTPMGTELVADLLPDRAGTSGVDLTVVGEQMFFVSDSVVVGQSGLWVSDGTADGTRSVSVEGAHEDSIHLLTPYGDRVLFASNGQLFVSNGTTEGSHMIAIDSLTPEATDR